MTFPCMTADSPLVLCEMQQQAAQKYRNPIHTIAQEKAIVELTGL